MELRPDKHPGNFKIKNNQAGSTQFVAHDLVEGTLEKGFEIYQGLQIPLHRAIFMMFLISEIHPITDGKYGHTTNHVLIRKFLRSALAHLSEEGCVLITAVDNAYYNGMFKFEDAADFADYHAPHCMDFDPAQFSGYSYTNTNDDDRAIEDHKKFTTWIFKPKT